MPHNATPSRITAVCFDAFGTLISVEGKRLNPYRHLFSTSSESSALRLSILTRNVSPDVLAGELGLEAVLPIMRQELGEELSALRCFPEVDEVMDALRRDGMRIGVCSNLAQAYGPHVRELVPGLDAYILSYEHGVAKPDPAIYAHVCKALDRQPQEVLFIGDSRRCDFHGPRAFGMQSCWLDRRSGMTLWDALSRMESSSEHPTPK